MTLILSNADVTKLLTIGDCIEVLEEAYVELAEGRGVTRPRSECLAPTGQSDRAYAISSTDSIIPKLGVGCSRITSDILTWPKQGASLRRVKVPAAPNGRYVGLVLLFSSETGEPLAIFPDGVIQRLRVGAASGLGVKYLARQDARTVGILGAGWQAGAQLMAVCAVRAIDSIRCFSPNRSSREAFAWTMSEMLSVAVTPVDSANDAVVDTDIVLCATNAIDNVFFERWIRPGLHFSSIKRQEVEVGAMRRADRLAIHTTDWNPVHYETRGFVNPEGAASKVSKLRDEMDFSTIPTLPQVIAGMAVGRRSDTEVTAFINNQGTGYQFAATGAALYRKAKAAGAGHELPTDWFTENEHN
jgi:ornithine cyclodeaminase/alanine dehydrogenase-like protein (mu-crystallin family)